MRTGVQMVAAACLLMGAATSAQAGFVVTIFGPAQWGASDATLGVSGYTIEDFEDTALASGLLVSRQNGATGNFAATDTLPSTSVFNPTTDPASVLAFPNGVWDASNVLINHPGPSFWGGAASNWYSDSSNWADLEFQFPTDTISVGFSLQQAEQASNQLLVNGVVLISDLTTAFAAFGSDFESSPFGPFRSRNGYIRIDATGGDTIQSITLNNHPGDGYAIDHLAFNVRQNETAVAEPATLAVLGIGLLSLRIARRRGQVA